MSMNRRLSTPVSPPMAWKGVDMAGDSSWSYCLSEKALAEIDAALKAVRAGGKNIHALTKADFPLPSIEADLASILDEVEYGRGFAVIRGVPVDRYSLGDTEAVYTGLGAYFGSLVSQNADGELLTHVTDLGHEYGATNVRGYTTRSGQPFHNDASDIVALLCVRKAKSGGLSSISSSMAVYNEFLKNYPPEFLEQLYAGFYYDRRGEERQGVKLITERRLPVFCYYEGYLSCRYAYTTIVQAAKKSGHPLAQLEEHTLNAFNETAARKDIRLDMDLQPGDIQILNNHTILHGRTGWEDYDEPDRKRLMLRLWFTPPNPRPLAPEAVNRYGTGERLGIPPARLRSAQEARP